MAVVGLGLATVGPVPARADTSTGSTTANVSVTGSITLSDLTGSFTLTGDPGTTATLNGAVTMTVTTNNPAGYQVTVQATTPTLTGSAGNSDTIPIGNLYVRETGSGPLFFQMSDTTAVNVHTQHTPSAPGGDNLSNDYMVNIPAVQPDTYRTTLDYIAATL
ncbi:hypothetical protein FHR32_008668 [Streptosporangium album]|uniref:WxL domain-containing protein n=1 Tax=Streptosporangium album TaxID=47479 RepID=A0A7W7WE13_9ACTN|nr:hypothetical protein [Streptosporangium album]MBB4944262.1 hypothetical protein [Streptosporangium album]